MSTSDNDNKTTTVSEGTIRPSISLRLIRHAESGNNEVYRNARYIYRGGTADFDAAGWNHYVDTHRRADPSLSEIGYEQAKHLGEYLGPLLYHRASRPVRVITSPMRRTLETIAPTLQNLGDDNCEVIVNGFYHESEGCHDKDKPEEGMNPSEITELLKQHGNIMDLQFVGFPDPNRGWYIDGVGPETRAASEERAAKFYLWLCEYLDQQIYNNNVDDDIFDAGVQVPGEEDECEHDSVAAPRQRRRRTALLVGHGDFMSLVLKRMMAGYGHYVETKGITHRSCFVHYNTGITELEYFGRGRFMFMSSNTTPHLQPYPKLRTGGSLKDGWSYLVPDDEFFLDAKVSVAFADDQLEEHVREQTQALKSLYLSSKNEHMLEQNTTTAVANIEEKETANNASEKSWDVEEEQVDSGKTVQFVVNHGLQVVGVATYLEESGKLVDVAVRPSAGKQVGPTLMNAVKAHARKLKRSGSLLVQPRTLESKEFFKDMGFTELDTDDADSEHLQMEH